MAKRKENVYGVALEDIKVGDEIRVRPKSKYGSERTLKVVEVGVARTPLGYRSGRYGIDHSKTGNWIVAESGPHGAVGDFADFVYERNPDYDSHKDPFNSQWRSVPGQVFVSLTRIRAVGDEGLREDRHDRARGQLFRLWQEHTQRISEAVTEVKGKAVDTHLNHLLGERDRSTGGYYRNRNEKRELSLDELLSVFEQPGAREGVVKVRQQADEEAERVRSGQPDQGVIKVDGVEYRWTRNGDTFHVTGDGLDYRYPRTD